MSEDGGIFQTLALSGAIGVILFSVFLYLRRKKALIDLHNNIENNESEDDEEIPNILSYKWSLHWFAKVMLMPLSTVERRVGVDAYVYLKLEQLLLAVLSLGSLLSLFVLYPLNVGGTQQSLGAFERTTVAHLSLQSGVLWVHSGVAVLIAALLCFSIGLWQRVWSSRRFARRSIGTCTVMLRDLPRSVHFERNALRRFLARRYGDADVRHVWLASDLTTLADALQRFEDADFELEYLMTLVAAGAKRPTLVERSVPFGCAGRCFWERRVDAVDATREQRDHAVAQLQRMSIDASSSQVTLDDGTAAEPTGHAFVTFRSPAAALEFVADIESHAMLESNADGDYNNGDDGDDDDDGDERKLLSRSTPSCTEALRLDADRWLGELAPEPDDVLWPALGMGTREHYIRVATVNAVLMAVFLFYTTPVAALTSLTQLGALFGFDGPSDESADWLTGYVPSLLLLGLAVVIPLVLHLSSHLEGYATHSKLERAGMRKVFAFLVLSTLLMPSFLSTSVSGFANAVSGATIKSSVEMLAATFPNSCMFVAFTLNAAFFSCTFDLLKLDHWLLGWLVRRRARSAEHLRVLAARAQRRPSYGFWYASLAAHLCVVCFYAVLVPAMLPAGALFMLFKLAADKHNLVYVHRRHTIGDSQVLRTASTFVLVAAAFLLGATAFVLLLLKRAIGPSLLCSVATLPIIAYYAYLSVVYWPRVDKRLQEALANDEAPTLGDDNDKNVVAYRHPAIAEYTRLQSRIGALLNEQAVATDATIRIDSSSDDDDNDHDDVDI
jgi:Calcium-dependent channel, 7TM region, putative phosphate/Late exocytosis, associated with Golgi transport/Cytosolic domain of 10TM putative phosphate transporter